MKKMRTMVVLKPVALYLTFACFMTAAIPASSLAYLVESQAAGFSRDANNGFSQNARSADMNKIQRVLESKMVSQRLSELGLSRNEINSKLSQLNDADVHQFASQVDSLMPGGELEFIIGLLIIAILVLVILQLTGHKVVVK